MKKSILAGIVMMLFSAEITCAQETELYLILQRGRATMQNVQGGKVTEIIPGKRETLSLKNTLTLFPDAFAIVYSRTGSVEVGSNREEKYTVEMLRPRLSQKSGSTAFSRFYDFLNRTYEEMKQKETLKGSVTAAAGRGKNSIDFFYFPADSSLIITDTTEISWGSRNPYELMSEIVVINTHKKDTVYNAKPDKSSVTLTGLREGEYRWTGTFNLGRGVTGRINNVFFIPGQEKRSLLLQDLSQFRGIISSYSDETKKSLLKKYIEQQRICCIDE